MRYQKVKLPTRNTEVWNKLYLEISQARSIGLVPVWIKVDRQMGQNECSSFHKCYNQVKI